MAARPPARPALSASQLGTSLPGGAPSIHSWKVVHACEWARDVSEVVEGQLCAGMRPFLVTPAGSGDAGLWLRRGGEEARQSTSPLHMWNHVRGWRKLLMECDAASAEVVHAHSFASGMAAVRALSGVVYDFREAVEEIAAHHGYCGEKSWLARSFRVAEQFVLTRAAAVIVHSRHAEKCSLERGVDGKDLFLIPFPVPARLLEVEPDREWRSALVHDRDAVLIVAPGLPPAGLETEDSRLAVEHMVEALEAWFAAFASLRRQVPKAEFVWVSRQAPHNLIRMAATSAGLGDAVHIIGEDRAETAIASSDIVIAGPRGCESLTALACGTALLAADVEANREVTPEGRGALWYRDGDFRDLVQRAAFLAGNPGFQRSLGRSGRSYIEQTRSFDATGELYDLPYRHAFRKRGSSKPTDGISGMIPLEAAG